MTVEQECTALLDSGTFTHRVNSQQPIEYDIEGLKYEGPRREWGSETTLERRQNTFKLYKDWCLT